MAFRDRFKGKVEVVGKDGAATAAPPQPAPAPAPAGKRVAPKPAMKPARAHHPMTPTLDDNTPAPAPAPPQSGTGVQPPSAFPVAGALPPMTQPLAKMPTKLALKQPMGMPMPQPMPLGNAPSQPPSQEQAERRASRSSALAGVNAKGGPPMMLPMQLGQPLQGAPAMPLLGQPMPPRLSGVQQGGAQGAVMPLAPHSLAQPAATAPSQPQPVLQSQQPQQGSPKKRTVGGGAKAPAMRPRLAPQPAPAPAPAVTPAPETFLPPPPGPEEPTAVGSAFRDIAERQSPPREGTGDGPKFGRRAAGGSAGAPARPASVPQERGRSVDDGQLGDSKDDGAKPKYQPYSMEDFKRINQPVRLGGRAPNDSDEVRERRARMSKMREYASGNNRVNMVVIAAERKDESPRPIAKKLTPAQQAAKERQEKARAFARNVPRPTVRAQTAETATEAAEEEEDDAGLGEDNERAAMLLELEERHQRDQAMIADIKRQLHIA